MLARGVCIHDYEVWGLLGEGGMSEVWLAKHSLLSIPVVIKTLRKDVAESVGPAGAQRMFDEARLMARVTSPRVVRAIDAGTLHGQPYLVQEYVDGVDMAELDRERRAALGVGLPLWTVCHVMEETCRALHAAHQAGVVHRDVKPSNLFAAPETGIRLGDFGIAVANEDRPTTAISGTLKFMAPEQLRGEPADRTTDAYGAGATAFDLRYGRAPFRDVAAATDELVAPAFPQPRSPAEAYFQHLLRGMLAKRKEDRPPDLCEPASHFATLCAALRPWREHDALAVLGKNHFRFLDCEITLRAGDIADEEVDGIVSSANYEMTMRTGVGDALRRRGGDAIEAEAMKDGHRALGECVPTQAGSLKADHVLHAVSAWSGTSCVGRATERALSAADRLGLRTLAFPALGTGAAHVSIETCANAMVSALRWRLALGGSRLQKVSLVLGDETKLAAFRDVAVEALRGASEPARALDLGLPDDVASVTAEGATFIDASSKGASGKTQT
ncbi:MAG: serine/threonine-protein kinase [Polyangiaceae bacterium]